MARTIRIYSLVDVDRSGKVRWTACELDYEIEESRISIEDMRGDECDGGRHLLYQAGALAACIAKNGRNRQDNFTKRC